MQPIFGVWNGLAPRDGQPKALAHTFDFTASGTATLDLLAEIQQGGIEFVQSIWVDNADNAAAVIFNFAVTNQRLKVPANTQGWYPVIAPEIQKIVVTTTQGVSVNCLLLNVPSPFAQSGPVTLNVANVAPAQGTWTDRSGFIAVGNTSQQAMAANANRKALMIENPSTEVESLFVNFTAAATTNGAATPTSYEILPGGYFPPPSLNVVSTEAINVIATTINHKYIAKEM